MKTLLQFVIYLAAFILVGCIHSGHSFYLEEDLIEMDEIVGTWQEIDIWDSNLNKLENEIFNGDQNLSEADLIFLDTAYEPSEWVWIIEKGPKNNYTAFHHNAKEINTFIIHSFELYGQKYLDIYPDYEKFEDRIFKDNLIPTHTLARIKQTRDYALVEVLVSSNVQVYREVIDEMVSLDPDGASPVWPHGGKIYMDSTKFLQEKIQRILPQDTAWLSIRMLKKMK